MNLQKKEEKIKLRNFMCLSCIIAVTKWRREENMYGKTKNAWKILVGNPEEYKIFGRPGCRQ
jgi:hypothetical protein